MGVTDSLLPTLCSIIDSLVPLIILVSMRNKVMIEVVQLESSSSICVCVCV
jgi:hypothetical protein